MGKFKRELTYAGMQVNLLIFRKRELVLYYRSQMQQHG